MQCSKSFCIEATHLTSISSQATTLCQKTVLLKAFIVSKSGPRGMISYHRPIFLLHASNMSSLNPMNAWSISFAARVKLSKQSIFACQSISVFFSSLLLALYYAFGRISYPASSVATFSFFLNVETSTSGTAHISFSCPIVARKKANFFPACKLLLAFSTSFRIRELPYLRTHCASLSPLARSERLKFH